MVYCSCDLRDRTPTKYTKKEDTIMMAKRILSVLLLLAILLSALVSCKAQKKPQGQEETEAGTSQDQWQPAAPEAIIEFGDGIEDPSLYPYTELTGLGDLRVMSFNVLTTASDARWAALVREVKSYAPDLLGLQEDSYNWNSFMSKELVQGGTYQRINSSINASGEYCSIYYNTERFELVADKNGVYAPSGGKRLTHNGNGGSSKALTWEEVPQTHRDALNMKSASDMGSNHTIYYYKPGDSKQYSEVDSVLDTRLMSYGVFRIKGTDKVFLYVNTHLQHRSQNGALATYIPEFLDLRERERIKQWTILENHVTKILEEYGDMPVFITGDLNEVVGSASYRHFATNFDNASLLAEIVSGPDGTWNQSYDKSYAGKEIVIEEKDRSSSSTLDYCFLSKGDFTVKKYQVGDGRVPGLKDPTKYIYTSDHRSIIVDLTIGKEEDDSPIRLQMPGEETSAISYYSGTPDVSWYQGDPANGETATYVLDTADKLMGFMSLRSMGSEINGKWVQDHTFCGVTVELGANMVINKGSVEEILARSEGVALWQPLNSVYYFQGIFDGKGHYISGVVMDQTDPDGTGYKGLLGGVGNAEIKNFALVNSYIGLPVNGEAPQSSVGSISPRIAPNATALFYNVYSACDIIETDGAHDFSVCGGIVGSIHNQGSRVTLDHCVYAGKIVIEGNRAGGLVGQINSDTGALNLLNCISVAKITGGDYTGGLIGYAKAKELNLNNCVVMGDLVGLRMSGGLVGAMESCPDFNVSNCMMNADLDFSGINRLDEDPDTAGNQVAEGCQVGGLIGKTYDVTGYVNRCTVAGSMKGATGILTAYPEESSGVKQDTDEYASGAIFGFNAGYSNNLTKTDPKNSYIAIDHMLIGIEMTDVECYLGGSRNLAVDGGNSKISYYYVIYDAQKAKGLTLWGTRTDKNRTLDYYASSSNQEKNDQIGSVNGLDTARLFSNQGYEEKKTLDGKVMNYAPWPTTFVTWSNVEGTLMVRTQKLKELVEWALQIGE